MKGRSALDAAPGPVDLEPMSTLPQAASRLVRWFALSTAAALAALAVVFGLVAVTAMALITALGLGAASLWRGARRAPHAGYAPAVLNARRSGRGWVVDRR